VAADKAAKAAAEAEAAARAEAAAKAAAEEARRRRQMLREQEELEEQRRKQAAAEKLRRLEEQLAAKKAAEQAAKPAEAGAQVRRGQLHCSHDAGISLMSPVCVEMPGMLTKVLGQHAADCQGVVCNSGLCRCRCACSWQETLFSNTRH
jgi:ATPase subunit of ABC transporter with duplicated ATPase domains